MTDQEKIDHIRSWIDEATQYIGIAILWLHNEDPEEARKALDSVHKGLDALTIETATAETQGYEIKWGGKV